jgi:excisionase family DNA binding protein
VVRRPETNEAIIMEIKQQPDRLVYSIKQAVATSTLSRASLYRAIRAGKLDVRRVGRRTLIPAEALHKLLEGDNRDAI